MDLGPHATFIVASYAFAALVLGGLVVRAIVDHRVQRRALAELEARGATIRGAAPQGAGSAR